MKDLQHYGVSWTVWLIVALAIVFVIVWAFVALPLQYEGYEVELPSFRMILAQILSPSMLALVTFPILVIVAVARIARQMEVNIKAENIGLHQFNMGTEASSPKDLLSTGIDKCLEAGIDPKELVAIMRERYQQSSKS